MKLYIEVMTFFAAGFIATGVLIVAGAFYGDYHSPDFSIARPMNREDVTCDIANHTITLKQGAYSDPIVRAIELCGWAGNDGPILVDGNASVVPRTHSELPYAVDGTSCITKPDGSKIGEGCK